MAVPLSGELQEGFDRLPESLWILDMRRVSALRQLDQRGAGNARGKFVGEGRRRRRIAQADHDQRGIADRAERGASIEPSERAAGGGEMFRRGRPQARLALL